MSLRNATLRQYLECYFIPPQFYFKTPHLHRLLHTGAFTQNGLYTDKFNQVYTKAFSHRNFYIEILSHRQAVLRLLHTGAFAQKTFAPSFFNTQKIAANTDTHAHTEMLSPALRAGRIGIYLSF